MILITLSILILFYPEVSNNRRLFLNALISFHYELLRIFYLYYEF